MARPRKIMFRYSLTVGKARTVSLPTQYVCRANFAVREVTNSVELDFEPQSMYRCSFNPKEEKCRRVIASAAKRMERRFNRPAESESGLLSQYYLLIHPLRVGTGPRRHVW